MKKRMLEVVGAIVIFLIVIIISSKITQRVLDQKATLVTRYELAQYIADAYSMENYLAESPYADVNNKNEYYNAVCAAYAWGYLPKTVKFDGKKKVTGEYVVLGAIKSIDPKKLSTMMGKESLENVSDNKYIDFAVDEGIVDKKLLKKKLSLEECKSVLSAAVDLEMDWKRYYQGEVFEYKLADNVAYMEVDASDFTFEDENNLNSAFTYQAIEGGTIIQFEKDGLIYLKKVNACYRKDDYYRLDLQDADLNSVFEDLKVETASQIDLGTYYDSIKNSGQDYEESQLTPEALSELNDILAEMENTPVDADSEEGKNVCKRIDELLGLTAVAYAAEGENGKSSFAGIMIGLNASTITVTKLDTGGTMTVALPSSDDKPVESGFTVYLYVKDIAIYHELEIKHFEVEKVNIGFETLFNPILCGYTAAHFNPKTNLPFARLPLPGGIVSMGLNVGASIDLTGSLNMDMTAPIKCQLKYTKENKFSWPSSDEKARIEFTGKGEVEFKAYPIIDLSLFQSIVVLDLEPFGGLYGYAELRTHGLNEMLCIDGALNPISGIMICGVTGDRESLLGKLADTMGYYDRTFYFASTYADANMLKKLGKEQFFHYHSEMYPGASQFIEVDNCTYGNEKDESWWESRNKELAISKFEKFVHHLSVEATDSANKEKTSEEDFDYTKGIYDEILNYWYYQAKDNLLPELWQDIGAYDLETLGYAFMDFDGDNKPELLIGKVNSQDDEPFFIMYTRKNDSDVVEMNIISQDEYCYLARRGESFVVETTYSDDTVQIYYTPFSEWIPTAERGDVAGQENVDKYISIDALPSTVLLYGLSDVSKGVDDATGWKCYYLTFDRISGYEQSDIRHTSVNYENASLIATRDCFVAIWDQSILGYIEYPVTDILGIEDFCKRPYYYETNSNNMITRIIEQNVD